jgi:glycosyltransferase involved in cell wall biosynthesis
MAAGKNILIFTCFNARSVHMESTVLYFKNKGYHVSFLTTCETGPIHAELKAKGVRAEAVPVKQASGLAYNLQVIGSFIGYCRKHQINFVYSHLQMPNFISSVSRFFIKAKVFTVRHNSDVIELSGTRKEKLIEKLINKFSSHIIAISDKVKQQLTEKEGVNPAKIYRINNGYNFSAYDALSSGANEYRLIREKYACDLLIVSPGRLIPTKRHQLSIQGIRELKLKGFNVKLLILGDGPDADAILNCVKDHGVEDRVHLLGYLENIADYLKAADVVALLSESEASSNIIKEAGYFEKPVIACEQVGDFSDYLVNGTNGFLISKNDPLPGFINTIQYLISHKDAVGSLGSNLHQTIVKEFDIEAVGKQYEELQSKV